MYCFSFDERQCRTDPWAENQEFNVDLETLEQEISDYLKDNGVDIVDVEIDPNYHDAVCEACHVCPSGKRIFISTSSDEMQQLNSIDLLSLEKIECGEVF